MGIVSRLREWSAIGRVRPVEEALDAAGGRDGELMLRELIGSSFPFQGAHLLAGRRIPSRRQGRRREIDLIVCTPAMIHLIEVKNWSGRLDVRDGAWRQTRRNGEVVDHGDLLRTNLQKRDAVVEFLGDGGVALDARFARDHIVPKVIFTNPRLELDPAIEALPEVISRRELDAYLGRQPARKGLAERMCASVIAFCLASEAKPAVRPGEIPRGQYERIVARLAESGTWDRLHFHGTRVITGDVVCMKLGPKVYRAAELASLSGRLPIHLRWTRGRLWGLWKALTGLGRLGRMDLGNTRMDLSPDDTVTFHAVGDREPADHKLVELDMIVLGG